MKVLSDKATPFLAAWDTEILYNPGATAGIICVAQVFLFPFNSSTLYFPKKVL